jgi:uncharacterized lipoprotein YbaY
MTAAALLLLLLSGCVTGTVSDGSAGREYKPITGSIELGQSILLKTGISVELELLDVTSSDQDPALIAKQIIKNPKRLPIQFSLRFDSDDIRSFNRYIVRMTTFENDTIIFQSERDQPVLTQGNPDTVTIRSTAIN